MNKEIIYLKEVTSYDDVLKNKHDRMPLFFKKIIFLYKNIFNIITRKKIEEHNVWILPLKEKYYENKMEKLVKKNLINSNNIYVLSSELNNKQIYKVISKKRNKQFRCNNIIKYYVRYKYVFN